MVIVWKVKNGEYALIGAVVFIKEKRDIEIIAVNIYIGLF